MIKQFLHWYFIPELTLEYYLPELLAYSNIITVVDPLSNAILSSPPGYCTHYYISFRVQFQITAVSASFFSMCVPAEALPSDGECLFPESALYTTNHISSAASSSKRQSHPSLKFRLRGVFCPSELEDSPLTELNKCLLIMLKNHVSLDW